MSTSAQIYDIKTLVMQPCNCFSFIWFLLGQPQGYHNIEEKGNSAPCFTKYGRARYLRYVIPLISFVVLAVDIGDWIVHGEHQYAARQNRVIEIFSFLWTQLQYCLTGCASFVFVWRAPRVLQCGHAVVELKQYEYQERERLETASEAAKLTKSRIRRYRSIFILLVAVGMSDLLLGIIKFPYGNTFWRDHEYFIFASYLGYLRIAALLLSISCYATVTCLYLFFLFLCLTITEHALILNSKLRKATYQIISEPNVPSKVFDAVLCELGRQERRVDSAIGEMDFAFRLFVAVVFVGNSFSTLSTVAQGFRSSVFSSLISGVSFVTGLVLPMLPMVLFVLNAEALNDCLPESVKLWEEIHFLRAEAYRKSPIDAMEKLLLTTYKPKLRSNTLTVAGMTQLGKRFGVTLLVSFTGLLCFLWDRNEQFQAGQSVSTCSCNITHLI